jgi:hypothetical protein
MTGHVTMDLCLSNGSIGRNVLSKGNVVRTTYTYIRALILSLIFRGIKIDLHSLFITITILLCLFLYLPLFFFLRLLLHLHTYLLLLLLLLHNLLHSFPSYSFFHLLHPHFDLNSLITHHTSNILQMHVPSLYTALRKTTWGGLVPLLQDDMVTAPRPLLYFSSYSIVAYFILTF